MTKRSFIHLYIIITCLILAVGAAVGTVCHFLSDGFFNYGAEYASDAEVTVNYSLVDYTQSDIEGICEGAFSAQGLNSYTVSTYGSDGYIRYAFSYDADETKLSAAVAAINAEFTSGDLANAAMNNAVYSYNASLVSNSSVYIWCSVAAAIAIGIEAVYIAIRYKISMGAVSLLANVNSLLLFISLLAITRIPFGSYVATVALICLLVSMISVLLFFAKVRSNFKDEDMSKLTPEEHITGAAAATTTKITYLCGAMLAVSVVIAVASLIATFSISAMAPALAAVCACVACWYSSALLTPCLYACVRGNKEEKADKKAKKDNKEN